MMMMMMLFFVVDGVWALVYLRFVFFSLSSSFLLLLRALDKCSVGIYVSIVPFYTRFLSLYLYRNNILSLFVFVFRVYLVLKTRTSTELYVIIIAPASSIRVPISGKTPIFYYNLYGAYFAPFYFQSAADFAVVSFFICCFSFLKRCYIELNHHLAREREKTRTKTVDWWDGSRKQRKLTKRTITKTMCMVNVAVWIGRGEKMEYKACFRLFIFLGWCFFFFFSFTSLVVFFFFLLLLYVLLPLILFSYILCTNFPRFLMCTSRHTQNCWWWLARRGIVAQKQEREKKNEFIWK